MQALGCQEEEDDRRVEPRDPSVVCRHHASVVAAWNVDGWHVHSDPVSGRDVSARPECRKLHRQMAL